MKKGLFSLLIVGLIMVSSFFVLKNLKQETPVEITANTQVKNNKIPKAKRIKEALEWRNARLINPEKGYFDAQDLVAAHKKADFLKANAAKKSALLNLQWELLGPDNQGGRTRALIFDANVPNKLWAGSVGGGLFKSEDAGNSWTRVETYNGNFPIASIAQASDGALYVGTGEGLGNSLSGSGASSFSSQSAGNGIYKSVDEGLTWTHLSATNDLNDFGVPTYISGSCTWCGVNDIAISPVNPQVVLAGTERGLHISNDGGTTFTQVSGFSSSNQQVQSIEITSDGQIAFAVFRGRLYRSVSVADNFVTGWTQANISGASGVRADVAIAPSNENYVYLSVAATNNCMAGIWRSTDAGDTWTQIVSSGAPSYERDPFNQPTAEYGACNGQGWYDQTIAVNPADENKIYIGGITLYTWGDGIGFRRADKIDTEGGTPFDSDYIHADKHEIIFNPQDPTGNTMLVGSDGGVTLCDNALTGFPENLNFIQKNRGYATLQVYGMGAGKYGEVLSGNQDNGSQYIDGRGSSVQAATEVSGGDGVYAEVSNLDPDVLFTGVYYGDLMRSVNAGQSVNDFLDDNIDPENCGKITCTTGATACQSNYAAFIYPFYLLETSTVGNPLQTATLIARNDTLLLANGSTQIIRDVLEPTKKITTIETIYEDSTTVETIEEVKSTYEFTSYTSPELKLSYPITQTYNPGDTVYKDDTYDAKYFVASSCGIWMCINPLQKNKEPHFYKLTNSASNVKSFDSSPDGDNLYYVVGRSLYIITGLNQVNASLNINEGCRNNGCTPTLNVVGPINITGLPSSPGLEGVSVDRNDPNTVLVTAAGFGTTGKVFRIENALSGAPVVIPLQPDDTELPYMPVYDCVIDAGNSNRYILGTELGIWTSDDAGVTWNEENNGLFGRMPIYRLRQEWLYEEGCNVIYAGTHGGGMFRTVSLTDGSCDTEPYKWPLTSITEAPLTMTNVNIYPNPVVNRTKVEFDLKKSSKVSLRVFDMMGKLVFNETYSNLHTGVQVKEIDLSQLTSGTYSVVLSTDGEIQGNKMLLKK